MIFYKNNDWVLYSACVLNVISLALTAFGLLEPLISFLHITNYLNIFNWCGIFAAGMLVKRKISFESLYKSIKLIRIPLILVFAIIVSLLVIFDTVAVGYFSCLGIFIEILGAFSIFAISTFFCFENRVFRDISNLSFTIYLIHMMVIGVFDKLYNIQFLTQLISSVIVVAISYIVLCGVRLLSKLIKCQQIFDLILGIRNKKKV